MKRVLLVGALASIVGAMVGSSVLLAQAGESSGPPAARVVVDAARLEKIGAMRSVTGELRARRRSLVASEESGRVVELIVERGDVIEANQSIARLDSTLLDIDLREAAAELRRREGVARERKVQVEIATRDLGRLKQLLERGSATQSEFDDAVSLLDETKARLDQAEAERDVASLSIERMAERKDNMLIRAPFAGAVVDKRTEVGQWVADGEAVVEIVSLDEIDAWLATPDRFAALLGGPDVTVQLKITATGELIEAPIAGIVPDADPVSRMIPVRISLDNTDRKLSPGMSLSGLIPTGGREEMLTIHKDSILRDDAGAYVYFDMGGMAMAARIEPQYAVGGDRVVIRSERVKPGMLLIVEGNERLYPTQPIKIVPGAPKKNGGNGGAEMIPPRAETGESEQGSAG